MFSRVKRNLSLPQLAVANVLAALALAGGCAEEAAFSGGDDGVDASEGPSGSDENPTDGTFAALPFTFGAGSFIIPMDTAAQGQNSGMLRAYGLVYALLRHNVPVHWAIRSGKQSDQADFPWPIPPPPPPAPPYTIVDFPTGTEILPYRPYSGGPFLVSDQNREAAEPIIREWLDDDAVTAVHVVDTGSLTVNIARTLINAPRIAVLLDSNAMDAIRNLNEAGIPDSSGASWENTSLVDSSPDLLTEQAVRGSTTSTTDGALFNLVDGTPRYCHFIAMHYAPAVTTLVHPVVQEVRSWLDHSVFGGLTHAFMQCLAAETIENDSAGHFLTTTGIRDDGASPPTPISRYPSDPLNQIQGNFAAPSGFFDSIGLAGPLSTPPVAQSVFKPRARTLFNQNTLPLVERITYVTGVLDGTLGNGRVSYLAGHDFGIDLPISLNPETNGTRLFLNAILEASCATASTIASELTISKTAPTTISGSSLTFTIGYENGARPAENVILRDVLPDGTTFVSATGGGTESNGVVTWNVGTVAAGGIGSVQVTVAIATDGTYQSTATVTFAQAMALRVFTSTNAPTVRDAAPTVMISGPSGVINNNRPEFTFTVDDPLATTSCRFTTTSAPTNFVPCTSPVRPPLPGLDNGEYQFEVRATDTTNHSGFATRDFIVAVGAPSLLVSGPSGDIRDNTPTYTFSTDPGATLTCSFTTPAVFVDCSSPFRPDPLADGAYVFQFRATTSFGETTTVTRAFTVDTGLPQVMISGPISPNSDTTPRFTFTLSPGGTATTAECRIDSGPLTDCTAGVYEANPALVAGVYTFQVIATDAAGNRSVTLYSFDVVIGPLTVTIDPEPAGPTQIAQPTFTFTASDVEAATSCRLYPQGTLPLPGFVTCTGTFMAPVLGEGSYVFEVRAIRAMPAATVIETRGFTVDTLDPIITVTGGPINPTPTNIVTPRFEFTISPGGTATTALCDIDGGQVLDCTTGVYTGDAPDGPHVFHVIATDAAGNSTTHTRPFTVDGINPDVTITGGPVGTTGVDSPVFTFTTVDAVGIPQCRAAPAFPTFGDCTTITSHSFMSLADGSYTFEVRVRDAAGNEDTDQRIFAVDATDPSVIFTGGPSGLTRFNNPTFTFTVGGGPTSIECRIDTVPSTSVGFVDCSTLSFPAGGDLADGSYVFEVRVIDSANNSVTFGRPFTMDTTAPMTGFGTRPSNPTGDPTGDFVFTSTEVGSSFECTLDDVPVSCTAMFTTASLSEGSHTLTVRAVDAAGNPDPETLSYTWAIDTTEPETFLGPVPRNPTNLPDFSFTFSSSDQLASFLCSLDGLAAEICTSPFVTSGLLDGEHTFTVTAIDSGETMDPSPAVHTWFIDTFPPNTILTDAEPDQTSDAVARFTFEAVNGKVPERNAVFECSLDGGPFTDCESPFQTAALADGTHTFEVQAIDEAGNTDPTPASHIWRVDAAASELDPDDDGVLTGEDNCPTRANPEQEDLDEDGLGDACDRDKDGDGWDDLLKTGGGGCLCRSGEDASGVELALILLVGLVVGRRRKRSGLAPALLALVGMGIVSSAGVAQAQPVEPKDYPVERLRLAIDRDGLLDTEWTSVGPHLSWDFSMWLSHSDDPLVITQSGERAGELIDTRIGGSLTGAVSLWGRVKLGAELPVIAFQDRNSSFSGAAMPLSQLSTFRLGDLRVAPRIQLQRGTERRFGVAVIPSFTLPTSDRNNYAGEAGPTFAPELVVSRSLGAFRFAGNLGYRMRREREGVNLEVNDELFVHAGAGYSFAENYGKPIELHVSLSGATAANSALSGENRSPLEMNTAINYDLSDTTRIVAGAGIGLNDGFGTPDWRIFAGVRFTHARDDLDGDGIKTIVDRCPNDAEDRDGFEDRDGCPDLDDDGDRIADLVDQCPREPEAVNGFLDEDGCADVVPPTTVTGVAWYGGPLIGGIVTAYQLVDGRRTQVLGTATTSAGGAFMLDLGTSSGSVELEVTGGAYAEASGGTVHLGGGDVLRGIALSLQVAEQRTDVAVTPWSDLTIALGKARLARGKEITYDGAVMRARDLLVAHLGFDPTHTAIVTLARKCDAGTPAVKHALSLAGLSQLAATAAADQGVPVQVINTRALLTVLRRDASSAEALFDGNGAESLYVGATCSPPPGCSTDGPGCYASCAVHTSSLRGRLGAAVLEFLASGANGTGIGRDHVLAWVAAIWNNLEPELFGAEPAEALDLDGPMIAWPTPAEGTIVVDSVPVAVTAADLVGIQGITIVTATSPPVTLVDNAPAAEQFTAILSTAKFAEGSHTLVVTAVDRLLNSTTISRAFVVDRTAPAITAEGVTADGFHDQTTMISYSATDPHLRMVAATLDGALFPSGTTVTTEGRHTLVVTASDRAGNLATMTIPFTVDGTAPGVTIVGVEDGESYAEPPTIRFEGTDVNLKSVTATVDGGEFLSGGVVVGEGPHTLVVTAVDRAGVAATVTRSFKIDSTAPVILTWVNSVLSSAGPLASSVAESFSSDESPPLVMVNGVIDGDIYQSARAILFTGRDSRLAKTTATLNGAAFASGDTVTDEGTHTLVVTAVDEDGQETSVSKSFTIDKSPPVIGISGVTADGYHKGALTISYEATDPSLVRVSALLDGKEFASGSTVTADGVHSLVVTSIDRAGNASMSSVPFVVDNVAPVIIITGVTDGGAYQTPPVIGFDGRDLNLSAVTAMVDGVAFAWGGKVTGDGSHTLVVTATDLAGHSTTATRTFVVDRTAPLVTVKGVTADQYLREATTIGYEATDVNLRTVTATLDGVVFVSETTVSAEGLHKLVVIAVDRAGNTSSVLVPFTYDATPPVVTVTGVMDGETYLVAPVITFEARDRHLVSAIATLDGAPFTSGVTVTGDGVHTLMVTGTDGSGLATTVTRTFTVSAKAVAATSMAAPVIIMKGVTAGGYHLSPVLITFDATDSDLRSVGATLNGADFVSGTVVSKEGPHLLLVTASDRATNTASVSVSFTLDGTAPVVSVSGVGNGESYTSARVVTFDASDANLLNVVATLDGAPIASGANVAAAGTHTLVVTATDRVGLSTTVTHTFKVEVAVP